MTGRFTIDGSDELEAHLRSLCTKVLSGVENVVSANELEALFLGGGYGRGEGGVLRTDRGDKPYNDMEFYVCIRGFVPVAQRKSGRAINELAHRLSEEAGIEVELKPTSLNRLISGQVTMFLYDLASGHKTLFGDPQSLSNQRLQDASNIPLSEATRLLMNRSTGLLFCEERLRRSVFTPEDADFVGRNHAKAQLAFGDVILTAIKRYHWSCRERNERLKTLCQKSDGHGVLTPFPACILPQIYCHHSAGTNFKLYPQRKTGERKSFLSMQTELCSLGLQLWLWLESTRLQTKFSSIGEYCTSEIDKCAETNKFLNPLINLRTFGVSAVHSKWTRYPRERIFQSLPLLLWEPATLHNQSLLRHVQDQLNTTATDLAGLIESYSAIWKTFS